jgi:hypothetical protein
MKRHIPVLVAVVVAAILGVLTVHFAQSSDAGSTNRGAPAATILPAPTVAPSALASCTLAVTESTPAGVRLIVTGTCNGEITEGLHCVESDEEFNGSVRRLVDEDNDFFLTVIVPDFNGTGDYTDGMMFAQVSGTAGGSRWTNREVPVHVDDVGVLHLDPVDLDAEPGTSTTGSLTLTGSLGCG